MPRPPWWSSGCHSATASTATLLAPAPGTHYTIKPVCLTAGKLIDLCNWGKSHSAAHTLSPAQPCLHPCGCMSTPRLSWRPLQDPLLSAWPHGSFLCTHNSPVASSEATQGNPITLTGMGRAPSPWVQDLAPSQGLCAGAGAAPSKQSCTTIADFLFMLFFAFSSLALLILQGLCATHCWTIASVF